MSKKQLSLLSFILFCSLVGSFLFAQSFPLNTDILSSLGRNYFNDQASSAYKKYEKRLERQVVLAFEGENLVSLHLRVEKIVNELSASGVFKEFGLKKEAYSNLNKFYFNHRDLFLTPKQKELIREENFEELKNMAILKMYMPFFSGAYKLKNDPLLVSDGFMEGKSSPFKLVPYGEFSMIEGEVPTLIVSGTISTGMEERALERLEEIKKSNTNLKIYYSSLAFYGVYAKNQARFESTLFSILSVVIILFIFLLYFKTLRHLIIATCAISICCLLGFVLTYLVFGEIYLMTFLLGISILGIMADYFIHYFFKERSLEDGQLAFKNIQKPLSWSLVTSVSGFLLFTLAPLPILKQFGVFSATTLCLAYLFVQFVMPIFFKRKKASIGSLPPNELLHTRFSKKTILFSVAFSAFISLCWLLGKDSLISNDIRSFSSTSIDLKKDEDKIKSLLGIDFSLKLFLVEGKNDQELLKNEQRLKKHLGDDLSLHSFSDWVPTKEEQLISRDLYSRLPGYTTLNSDPLLPSKATTLFNGVDFTNLWLGKVGERFYSIVPLLGGKPISETQARGTDSSYYLDKVGFINSDIEKFQRWLNIGGSIFILILLIVISLNTSLRNGVRIIGIPVFSILTSLFLSSLVLGSLNLFNFLGCVLIFGLGIDYAFFYYFNRQGNISTAKAIEVSTLTTLASFGVMSLSSTVAVKSFGITVLFGIILTWLFIPLSARELSDG